MKSLREQFETNQSLYLSPQSSTFVEPVILIHEITPQKNPSKHYVSWICYYDTRIYSTTKKWKRKTAVPASFATFATLAILAILATVVILLCIEVMATVSRDGEIFAWVLHMLFLLNSCNEIEQPPQGNRKKR